ncbi:hypothetical protein [Streptomyces sp. NBC_00076]|uniref:hypothetical protein n=1 Tax=Streptomyces sp. NBC_00076 TaxID=2975642 RepID=UPI00324AB6EC
MGDNKSGAVFNFGDGDVTFGGSVVLGDQVGVSGGVVYGDVVMGEGVSTEDTDSE